MPLESLACTVTAAFGAAAGKSLARTSAPAKSEIEGSAGAGADAMMGPARVDETRAQARQTERRIRTIRVLGRWSGVGGRVYWKLAGCCGLSQLKAFPLM